ncbi:MAG TPA: HAD family hydrolase [Gaiellaceae bacterium]|nr:HAD family hydrolase [Gaiellaceae bacterium]
MADRWATFDCYGTLVDWNTGIRGELERLFGVEPAERLLRRYHELEPEVQAASPGSSYRTVLTVTLERLAEETGLTLPEGETGALAHSLPTWPVFEDVAPALQDARERGWKLAILSNTDRDLLDASMAAIGVPFDDSIVAGEIGSYKPAERHWQVFRERVSGDAVHVHVAQSIFHDVEPASRLGIPCVWINRLGEPADPRPARTLASLAGLARTLDELATG